MSGMDLRAAPHRAGTATSDVSDAGANRRRDATLTDAELAALVELVERRPDVLPSAVRTRRRRRERLRALLRAAHCDRGAADASGGQSVLLTIRRGRTRVVLACVLDPPREDGARGETTVRWPDVESVRTGREVPVAELHDDLRAEIARAVGVPHARLDAARATAASTEGPAWLVRVPAVRDVGLPHPPWRQPEQYVARAWREGPGGRWRAEEVDSARDYGASSLPVLRPGRSPVAEEDERLLLTLYGEVTSAWRTLTDTRFKLLAFVPAASVAAWSALLSAELHHGRMGALAAVGVAIAGAVIVRALQLYDARNDELYDDLISRGRRIEQELGIHTAVFRGRRRAGPHGPNHTVPVRRIYRAAIVGWCALGGWFLGHALRGGPAEPPISPAVQPAVPPVAVHALPR